jgi:MFS family permease
MKTIRLAGITRPVWVLGVVSLLADLAGEMVYPIIPLFLTGTLGAPAAAVGAVEGTAEATANLTRIVSGRLSDRVRARKPFIVAGYALGAFGKLIVGVATVWPIALLGRSSDRFGKGIRGAPRDALLADLTETRYRGRVFGFHRSMDTLGAVGGPLIGLGLLALGVPLRWIILLAVLPGVAAIMALRWLPERRRKQAAAAPAPRAEPLPRAFILLLCATAIFMVGNSSDAFLILRSKDLGLSTTLVVLAYVCYNLVYAAFSLPAGMLSDRIPRLWLLVAGYLVFAAVYGGFAFAGSSIAVWPLFAVYGSYMAMTDGVSKALVGDLVGSSARSSAMGLFQGVSGLAALFASVVAGLLWDGVSVRAPFALGASCAVLAALALVALGASGRMRVGPSQSPAHRA